MKRATRSRTFFLAALFLAACHSQAETFSGIYVNGRGTLEVVPDMGTVTLKVRREGTAAHALKEELDEVIRSVLSLADKLGIAEQDVTATALNIDPRYRQRGNESAVEGLVATRTIRIILRDLTLFTELLNGSLAAGVNNVDPIRLDTSRRGEVEDEALTLAMEDAKQEAARVAAGFDVQLGPVTYVQVGIHSPRPQARVAGFAEASVSSFSPGVITIERTVSATFSILSGD